MYKRDLLQGITDAADMRRYKGMMKNIRTAACGRRYYCESGSANHVAKRSRRSL